MPDKPLIWLGGCRRDLRAFPALARRLAGFQLRRVQQGLDPDAWKPMQTVGSGVREIRIEIAGAHRRGPVRQRHCTLSRDRVPSSSHARTHRDIGVSAVQQDAVGPAREQRQLEAHFPLPVETAKARQTLAEIERAVGLVRSVSPDRIILFAFQPLTSQSEPDERLRVASVTSSEFWSGIRV